MVLGRQSFQYHTFYKLMLQTIRSGALKWVVLHLQLYYVTVTNVIFSFFLVLNRFVSMKNKFIKLKWGMI